MNDCDNFNELFSCARLAYNAGESDAEEGRRNRSTLNMGDFTQGFNHRKGHLRFLFQAYKMGRFNYEMRGDL